MSYVIRRVDQGGGWVTYPGTKCSYTYRLQDARVFASYAQAERELCPGNEIIETVDQAMGNWPQDRP